MTGIAAPSSIPAKPLLSYHLEIQPPLSERKTSTHRNGKLKMKNAFALSSYIALAVFSLLNSRIVVAQTPPPQKPEIEVPSPQIACDCHDLEAAQARIAKMDSTLKDWPNLARYRDANAKIVPPAKREKRVVFLGDSITDAWVLPQFGSFFPGKPYIDRGIGGQTTPQMLIRFRPDVIALQPKVVVILAGTNDIVGNTGLMSLEEIEANLTSMAELARAHHIKVVLASVLPVYDGGHNHEGKEVVMTDRRPPEKILALNGWIKKYSAEHKIVYLDYFAAMVDDKGFLKRELSEDGLHPNKAGYAVMAPLAEKAIQSALKM
jgi:lysophospholipase L1-like esterase